MLERAGAGEFKVIFGHKKVTMADLLDFNDEDLKAVGGGGGGGCGGCGGGGGGGEGCGWGSDGGDGYCGCDFDGENNDVDGGYNRGHGLPSPRFPMFPTFPMSPIFPHVSHVTHVPSCSPMQLGIHSGEVRGRLLSAVQAHKKLTFHTPQVTPTLLRSSLIATPTSIFNKIFTPACSYSCYFDGLKNIHIG